MTKEPSEEFSSNQKEADTSVNILLTPMYASEPCTTRSILLLVLTTSGRKRVFDASQNVSFVKQ